MTCITACLIYEVDHDIGVNIFDKNDRESPTGN